MPLKYRNVYDDSDILILEMHVSITVEQLKRRVHKMPDFSITDSLRRRWKRSISSFRAKPKSLLNVGEGEQLVVTYTSAVDKMKIFSAFIREGLENGDLVDYGYPDEESETVRDKLKEYGVDVEKYESEGSFFPGGLTEWYMPDGKFDKERAIRRGLDLRAEAKRRGYKHFRSLEDLGDFSFLNGQWQVYVDYWNDSLWETPLGANIDILDYSSFVIELTAFNIEDIDEAQLAEMLKAFWVGSSYTIFIDLLEHTNAFSKLIDLSHRELVGRKFLLEFDPASDYERVIDRLAKEATANVEPIFVFTSPTSSLHTSLVKQPIAKFFLLSNSVSTQELTSENEVVLPAKNPALILDALNKILEERAYPNVFLVFDKLSELIVLMGFDKAYKFLLYVLDMLFSKRTTAIFLLNASAHEPQMTYRIRGLFRDLLAYNKDGLKVVKIS
ncbi:hypothetical protein DRO69_10685 [Candidatus Bathyarchaeota archaeon]|nr:MAG: hypothetical protein DRO69_10685 [Candidatus Bathyarchaeota archaeon]